MAKPLTVGNRLFLTATGLYSKTSLSLNGSKIALFMTVTVGK